MTDDHLDARLDALLRDARRTYNPPPDLPDTEGMWAEIDQALTPAQAGVASAARTPSNAGDGRPTTLTVVSGGAASTRGTRGRPRPWQTAWFRMAAVLFLGVLIGRASVGRVPAVVPAATVAERPSPDSTAPVVRETAVTTEYLGRTEALLAALPSELEARGADPGYLSQADALLLQTRLLLDSPAATDPALRALFDDLEIVLAQVVRLRGGRDRTHIDFLEQALEQRDVLPRLRDAVAENAAADLAAD